MKIIDVEVTGTPRVTYSYNDEPNKFRLFIKSDEGSVLSHVAATFSFPFEKGDKVFLNGYQSWTLSRERALYETDNSMKYCPRFLDKKYGFSRYGDGFFYKRSRKRGMHHGYSYGYVRRGEKYFFFGSVAESTGFTRIVFNAKHNTVAFEKDCAGRKVLGDYLALDMYIAEGSEEEVFNGWFRFLGTRPLPAQKQTGYTSWYNYYQDISEKIILNDLEAMQSVSPMPKVFQIDDGFESKVGDWLTVDALKFPNGLGPVFHSILSEGHTAGIWLAPFVCEKDSLLYRTHPDWLLKDEKGESVFAGGNWSGAYALDFYNSEVRDYVRKCIAHYREMGAQLFKLDFLYAVCMQPRPNKTRGEIMDEAMEFLREACGDCMILGCGVPLVPCFGRVEYCRIGMDMTLDWNDKPFMRLFHPERPSTKHTLLNTVYRRQLSGRAFLNDPDVFLLRDYNMRLTPSQKLTLATVNCLFGGVLFTSDDFSRYSPEMQALYGDMIDLTKAQVESVCEKNGKMKIVYRLSGTEHVLEFSC